MPDGKVLLIEDDDDIRSALFNALEDEGYSVITAENGREGLRALEKTDEIAIVLVDLMMPVMNGEEFIQQVKSRGHFSQIPLIVVSANADRANKLGVSEIIRKPFDLDRLLSSVKRNCA